VNQHQFDVSVVIPTYNRSTSLAGLLESLRGQQCEGLRFEVVVVDNNSTDNTREVVSSFANCEPPMRYVFEDRQGSSHARNAGILQSQSAIVAFIDDDIRPAPNWISTVKSSFDEHPEIGFVGGKVLPVWTETPPDWLTSEHWSPLALLDYGDLSFCLEPAKVTGVIGANLAVRRTLFERVGMFSPKVQIVKGSTGGMEDHELIDRLWRAGIIGMYVPELVVHAPVEPERTRKKYHRRWHRGHGRTYAILREERMEKASWYLFGVPAHLYRQAMGDAVGLIKHSILRQDERAFLCEVRLWFFFGFWLQRVQDGYSKITSM
jgi:glucosyl-dolichyl phosphate glucuronosyltransferase